MSPNLSHRIDSAARIEPEKLTIPDVTAASEAAEGPSRVPKPRMLNRATFAQSAENHQESAADGLLGYRVDSQHSGNATPPIARQDGLSQDAAESNGLDSYDSDGREDWLKLQAIDLIDRIRAWSTDLDAREAQLNVRASLQDHRERQFRLSQQDAAAELAEQRRSIARIRGEIEAQARRIAFQG